MGWYQIRNALKERNREGYVPETDFSGFEATYAVLGNKLSPLVFDYGFLRD